MLTLDPSSVATVRHVVATLAYRASKVLRDAPDGFATFASGASARQPVQIVAHLADLMTWACTLARGQDEWKAESSRAWKTEIDRFFEGLGALDRQLAADAGSADLEKLIQGPLADALTHVGQLSMLRGVSDASVRPESYARAEITIGRVGLDQPAPKREFDGDASAR